MNDLVEQMKVVLATTFAFYLKSHFFHWNVEGANFSEYHKFFQNIYEDAFGAVDGIAEHIRVLDAYAPGSFERLKQLSKVQDETNIPLAMSMMSKLMSDNNIVIEELKAAEKLAVKYDMVGLSNFLQDRVDTHAKWGWQLKSILRN